MNATKAPEQTTALSVTQKPTEPSTAAPTIAQPAVQTREANLRSGYWCYYDGGNGLTVYTFSDEQLDNGKYVGHLLAYDVINHSVSLMDAQDNNRMINYEITDDAVLVTGEGGLVETMSFADDADVLTEYTGGKELRYVHFDSVPDYDNLQGIAPAASDADRPEDTSWKQLYLDFINSLDDRAVGGYQLIFIDNDDIPELAVPGSTHIAPSYLCWVHDGKLCQSAISFTGLAYFERKNKFLYEECWTGAGVDYIRCIDGDEAVDLVKGTFCTLTGRESYRWDGVDFPSLEEYADAKQRDFDSSAAQTLNNLRSYTEICKQINDY
ncbi:hypothetical protein SAMN02910436_00529 [Ruminococcaceae bacterium P7]|nr:hypothetical protein SAMN02910436_00529 [Ruminococcaceae bacterium P7]